MDDLKAKLAVQETELKQKNEDADKLIHVVGVETQKVSKEKAIADEEELKVQAINTVRGAEPERDTGAQCRTGQHELHQLWPLTPSHPIPSSPQVVTEKQRACETDLAKAEPALVAAQEALDTLNKVRDPSGGGGSLAGAGDAQRPRGPFPEQPDRAEVLRVPAPSRGERDGGCDGADGPQRQDTEGQELEGSKSYDGKSRRFP